MKALVTALALLALAYPAFAADAALTADQNEGRALYATNCTYCHGERGHATTLLGQRVGQDHALLEKRTNLTPELIRHVVRHGINSMPWFRRAELSDREVDLIARYLTRSNAPTQPVR